MPKKTPRGKKKKQQAEDTTDFDEGLTLQEIRNRTIQTRGQKNRLQAAEMDNRALLGDGNIDDGRQNNNGQQGQNPVRRLRDYITPNASGYQSAIAPPGIEANNFELKYGLIQMLSANPFSGGINEDPNQHLQRFVEICNTSKMNGVSRDAYYLRAFPFSLNDKARRWLDSHPPSTFTTWEGLAKAFLNQYFPPSKTIHYRQKIMNFRTLDGETLYEAWERYKDMMRMCPHHNLDKVMIVHTFYTGVPQSVRSQLDQAAGGAFADTDIDEAYDLIERTAQNAHLWSSERTLSRDRKGPQDLYSASDSLDPIQTLVSKVDDLNAKFDSLRITSSVANMSHQPNESMYCQVCGSQSHNADGCPVFAAESQLPMQEDANFVGRNQGNSFTPGSASNPYYNPNRPPHPNLSYGNQLPTPPGFSAPQHGHPPYPPRNQYGNQSNQNQQGTGGTSSLESMMAELLMQNKNLHAMVASSNAKYEGLAKTVEQLAVQNRMLETQVAQQANLAAREQGKLPSKPDPNPRNSVNAITLRNGKQLEMTQAKQTSNSESNSVVPRPENEVSTEENSAKDVLPPPYIPPVPFPQRLVAARSDKAFRRFVDKIRTLYITLPLTEAITQIPSYAKFMKDILAGKRKTDELETVALSEECSAAIQQPLPPKLEDPGSFSIPCNIGGITIQRALCDLGASVSIMPYSLYTRLNLGDLSPTNISIRLADRSSRLPKGILMDVPVKVGNVYIPVDFIVLEIAEDKDIPIILGRPFLHTAGAVIDVRHGSLTLNIGSEQVVFCLPNFCDRSYKADCNSLDSCVFETRSVLTPPDPGDINATMGKQPSPLPEPKKTHHNSSKNARTAKKNITKWRPKIKARRDFTGGERVSLSPEKYHISIEPSPARDALLGKGSPHETSRE